LVLRDSGPRSVDECSAAFRGLWLHRRNT
jgi:hypothetical protein